jgi:uncharacterized protein
MVEYERNLRMKEKHLKLSEIVKRELACSAHDLDHVFRVHEMCLKLAEDERDVDMDILVPAALLHDIARYREDQDPSGRIDHAVLGAAMAENVLRGLGEYSEDEIRAVGHCILNHRFRGNSKPESREAKILYDADKLDVLGAIGVARAYVIAGEYGERIFSDIPVDTYARENLVGGKLTGRIKQTSKHAPNLEYATKFKHIPERLYTSAARRIAEKRIDFMDLFFETLRREIRGEA